MKKVILTVIVLISINHCSTRKNNLLQYLSQSGKNMSLAMVNVYIGHGTDLNQFDDSGKSALFYAAQYNHPEIILLLADQEAKVNAQNENGLTALFTAVNYNHLECAKLLIKLGAAVDHKSIFGVTPLKMACTSSEENLDIVKLLVVNGAVIHYNDEKNYTPLESAIIMNKLETVRFFIEIGAPLNVKQKVIWYIPSEEMKELVLNARKKNKKHKKSKKSKKSKKK